MNYTLLFLGIGLVILAVVLFILDARKSRSEIRNLEKANAQTELLIEELNELSSIIVDELDKKYNNMLDIYKELSVVSEDDQQGKQIHNGDISYKNGVQQLDRKSSILELYDTGKSPSEIASRIGIGTGEVELIIKLAGRGVKDNVEII